MGCTLSTAKMVITDKIYFDMIYLSTAIGLTPAGSGAAHIYTQTIHRTTQITTEQHNNRTAQITREQHK